MQLAMISCSYNFIKLSMCSYNFNVAVRISINLETDAMKIAFVLLYTVIEYKYLLSIVFGSTLYMER